MIFEKQFNSTYTLVETDQLRKRRLFTQKRISNMKMIALASLIAAIALIIFGLWVQNLGLALTSFALLSFSAVILHDACKMSKKMKEFMNYWKSAKKYVLTDFAFKRELLKGTILLKHLIR